MTFKRLLSYFLPIRLKNYSSDQNGTLEINLVDGRKVLDTSSSNYSFGSLQTILERGLRVLPLDETVQDILVLGMGAGSVVESIRKKFHSDALITLVDIDPLMLTIAEQEFGIGQYEGVSIHIGDAEDFLQENRSRFDLVIVDLFIIDTIPEKFTGKNFIDLLDVHLQPGGKVMFNTIRKTLEASTYEKIKYIFFEKGYALNELKQVDLSNDLVLAYKPAGIS